MAFEGLTQKLAGTFKKLKNRGKLSEALFPEWWYHRSRQR